MSGERPSVDYRIRVLTRNTRSGRNRTTETSNGDETTNVVKVHLALVEEELRSKSEAANRLEALIAEANTEEVEA